MKTILILVSALMLCFVLNSCNDSINNFAENPNKIDTSLKITFVELGSVNCIPCQKMRPIMDSLQKKYGTQISVKFIDVIKDPQLAEPYKIFVMPTQVFLDTTNVEVYRHEGFYPEDSIHILLLSFGLKILNN